MQLSSALIGIATSAALAGDSEQAVEILGQVEAMAGGIENPLLRAGTLAFVPPAYLEVGEEESAMRTLQSFLAASERSPSMTRRPSPIRMFSKMSATLATTREATADRQSQTRKMKTRFSADEHKLASQLVQILQD